MKKEGFKSLDTVLDKLFEHRDLKDNFQEYYIMSNWKQLVKQRFHSIMQPVQYSNKILTIKTLNMFWAEEIKQNKDEILTMLRNSFSKIQLDDIKIIYE